MTEGYPTQWQEDVQAGPAAAEGRHEAVFTPSVDTYGDTTTYNATSVPTVPVADDDSQGKAGAAKEQAAAVGQGAAQAGQQVAAVAKDQAQNVVAEAGSQAKDLVGQARNELTAQAGTQQKRLAETLRTVGDELKSMADHDGTKGAATDLVSQASTRSHDVASWLDSRGPDGLLADVQGFARRRPGAFLALAAAAGLAAGRLGRGVKDASSDEAAGGSAQSAGAVSDANVDHSYEPAITQSGDWATSPSLGSGIGTDVMGSGADVESRPFASSQDSGFGEFPGSGAGL